MLKSIFLLLEKEITSLPMPMSITYMWNMGSILGFCLLIQILSGLFMAFHYEPSLEGAFSSVLLIMNDVEWGWFIRFMHANGASLFFICVYLHIGRGLFYGSFNLRKTWISGLSILLLLMMIAFMGYVLPWGQMSFWGATVITNLVSVFPIWGKDLVTWIWGGFSVSEPTLVRFFALHFILPFVLVVMVLIHISSLHSEGSSNPMGLDSFTMKISFHPFFSYKDILGLYWVVMFILSVSIFSPELFMDSDNFMKANPLTTPPHIQPEWYFLFAYSILRAIPSKLGGVIGLVMSILIILIFLIKGVLFQSSKFSPLMKMMFWIQVSSFFILSWLGAMPVQKPFSSVSEVMSVIYFTNFMVWWLLKFNKSI